MEQRSKKNRVEIEICKAPQEEVRSDQNVVLIYCLDGQLSVNTQERTSVLGPEDVLIVNANRNRRILSSDAEVLYAVFTISYRLLGDVLNSLDIMYWCDSSGGGDARYDELRRVLNQMLSHYIRTSGNIANFRYIMMCYQLMDIISLHFLVQKREDAVLSDEDQYEDRIRQINTYIHSNYAQPISMKDLSEQLYLSNGYLSRFFRKNYGMSFADYLTKVRLYHAADDLLYTKQPITRIAYDNGFTNEAVFNKAFKAAYQMTPSAFRRNAVRERQEEAKQPYNRETEEKLIQFLASREDAPQKAEPDCIEVESGAEPAGELMKIWEMVNVGSAQELLRSEIREHLLLLKKEAGIRYVRFWDLFSDFMLLQIGKTDRPYNFSRLDSILDFLVENQLKPHIELSPKPKRILRDAQTDLLEVDADAFRPPREDWIYFLDQLMQHLVRRYGRAETDTWQMELWWDERHPRDAAHAEQYMGIFGVTRRSVKQYSPGLKLGGFGLRFYHPAEETLLREWLHREDGPDFVSLTLYAYDLVEEGGTYYNKRNSDPDALTRKADWANRILQEESAAVPLYVTEWNLTISDRNYLNDSNFKGAYVMRHYLDFYGKVQLAAYYTATDRTCELYDSADPLFGGTGLLTKVGVMKPSGFAMKFLNHLYPYFVEKGEHYLITADGHGNYALVCQNMRPLSHTYFFVSEDQLEKENLWKYFADRNVLELNITLRGVPEGGYRQKAYRVNGSCGSVTGIWRELGYTDHLDREDMRYFRKINEPKMTMQVLETREESLQLDLKLEMNEILYLNLRRL